MTAGPIFLAVIVISVGCVVVWLAFKEDADRRFDAMRHEAGHTGSQVSAGPTRPHRVVEAELGGRAGVETTRRRPSAPHTP